MPLPVTSPTTRAVRAPDKGIVSNQPPCGAGHVQLGGFDGAVRGGMAGELVALDCCGDGVLAGESAGVVDTQGGVGGHIESKADVVLVVGIGPAGPVDAQHSQGRSAQSQRRHDECVRPGCADHPGPGGVGVEPGAVGAQGHEAGTEVAHGLRVGGQEVEAPHVAHRVGLCLLAVARAEGGTAQGNILSEWPYLGLLAAYHGIHDFHHGDVGKVGHQSLHQLLTGGDHVQGPSHTLAHGIQDTQPGTRLFLFRDVDDRGSQSQDRPLRVLQAEHRDRPDLFLPLFRCQPHAEQVLARGHAAFQHAAEYCLHLVGRGQADERLGEMPPEQAFDRHTAHAPRGGVDPHDPQLRIQNVQPYR